MKSNMMTFISRLISNPCPISTPDPDSATFYSHICICSIITPLKQFTSCLSSACQRVWHLSLQQNLSAAWCHVCPNTKFCLSLSHNSTWFVQTDKLWTRSETSSNDFPLTTRTKRVNWSKSYSNKESVCTFLQFDIEIIWAVFYSSARKARWRYTLE